MSRTVLTLLVALQLGAVATAQDPAFHANMRDRLDASGVNWADIWGRGNRGFIGYYGSSSIRVVDLTDPDNISFTSTHSASAPNNAASAQDVKIGTVPADRSRMLLFVALESGGDDGVEILDVTDPASPTSLTLIDAEPGPYEFIHNVSYREDGWLVICDSANPSLAIIDLRSYDPNSPPAAISSWTYELTGLGYFVHDVTITDNYLFISAWDCLIVYDVSNLGTSAPAFLGEVRGLNSHAVWPTDDEQYVITTEERTGGAARLFEIVDHGGSIDLVQRDSFVNPTSGTGESYSVHNPVVFDDRVYVSDYQGGALALQIDRSSKTWEKVASYDTSTEPPSGFAGAWGIYPRLGHDRVLVSDLQQGFHTIDFSALELTHPAPRPEVVAPGSSTPITIHVRELGNIALSAGTVDLHTSIDGAPFTSTTMSSAGGGDFTANLPSLSCGQRLDYYFSATSTGAEVFTSPADAPASFFTTYGATGLTTIFSDDFETNLGWTVTNTSVSAGQWVRGTPYQDGAQPSGGDPDAAGVRCFVTGFGSAGGATGADDVDGGPTRLMSPDIDFSAGDGLISYVRWYFDNNVQSSDALVVQVSDDGGGSWVDVETVTHGAGGWIEHTFRVSDYVTPTNQVRVRFSVSDNPNDSVTEALVDTVRASLLDCSAQPSASATFRNGSGVNATCYSTNPPVLGANWVSTVDHSAHPGATITQIRLQAAGSSGSFYHGYEILLDLSSPFLYASNVGSSGSSDVHSHPIPNNVSLAGIAIATQGLIFGGPSGVELCNAFDLVVGY